jgi:hypothetical protein
VSRCSACSWSASDRSRSSTRSHACRGACSSVAGEPVKAALIRRHVDYHESAASLVVAKTTMTISQVLFLAFGLVVVRRAGVDPRLFHALLIALAVETIATSGFVAVQTTRALGVVSALLMRLGLTAAPPPTSRSSAITDATRAPSRCPSAFTSWAGC